MGYLEDRNKKRQRNVLPAVIAVVLIYFSGFFSTGIYHYRTSQWTYRVHSVKSVEQCWMNGQRKLESAVGALAWPLYWMVEGVSLLAMDDTPYQRKCYAGEIGNDFVKLGE